MRRGQGTYIEKNAPQKNRRAESSGPSGLCIMVSILLFKLSTPRQRGGTRTGARRGSAEGLLKLPRGEVPGHLQRCIPAHDSHNVTGHNAGTERSRSANTKRPVPPKDRPSAAAEAEVIWSPRALVGALTTKTKRRGFQRGAAGAARPPRTSRWITPRARTAMRRRRVRVCGGDYHHHQQRQRWERGIDVFAEGCRLRFDRGLDLAPPRAYERGGGQSWGHACVARSFIAMF